MSEPPEDYGEPWGKPDAGSSAFIVDKNGLPVMAVYAGPDRPHETSLAARQARTIACVNALCGVADPVELLRAADELADYMDAVNLSGDLTAAYRAARGKP